MLIKICGLHPVRDVQLCIALKVALLGFVFYAKSPRNINLEEVKILKKYKKQSSSYVAVCVNPDNEFIQNTVLNNSIIYNYTDQKPMRELKKLNQWELR